jgi:hypothetical protein
MIRTNRAAACLAAAAGQLRRRRLTRKLLATLALALSLCAGTLTASAPAAADELSYLTAVARSGIAAGDGNTFLC